MEFKSKAPDWKASGIEPPASLKEIGFEAGYKPPAAYFNWFWAGVSACLTELHEMLANVDATKDVDKYVKFAQEAAKARKTEYEMTIRLNGGRTEGTDAFTFDGSTSRTVNITPAKIGAAEAIAGTPIVAAASTDGAAYTATVTGVTELTNGMLVTIIPNMTSTTTAPTFNLNGLGAKPVRLPLSTNTAIMVQPVSESYYVANRPITLQYDAGYTPGGAWRVYGKQRLSVSDLYGDFNLENLGDVIISDSAPETVEDGKWYLIKAEV